MTKEYTLTGTVQIPESIEATVTYLAKDEDGSAVFVASEGGGDESQYDADFETRAVVLRNARTETAGFDLDVDGFQLLRQESAVSDFYDDAQIVDTYESEIKTLVGDATGARSVKVFDHTRRSSSPEVRKARSIRESASLVHNDYTARSGPRRLREYFSDDPDQVGDLLEQRFAIVNVWRSAFGVVYRAPLALCNASSVSSTDLVSVTRVGKDRVGEVQFARYNPSHRWHYFPRMSVDEVLLIKTYDSATDGRARFTPHTSFEDPLEGADAPPRESIETRCFVFF